MRIYVSHDWPQNSEGWRELTPGCPLGGIGLSRVEITPDDLKFPGLIDYLQEVIFTRFLPEMQEVSASLSEQERLRIELLQFGHHVATIGGGSAKIIEAFVQEIGASSKQRVDWYYQGGRAVVVTAGDVEPVRKALIEARFTIDIMGPRERHQ